MNTEILQRQFESIGARLKVNVRPVRHDWRGMVIHTLREFTIDIGTDRNGEYFKLDLINGTVETLDMFVVDVQPRQRHLLLMARQPSRNLMGQKQKLLCGHDERHWFVASVSDHPGVASVEGAMEALKPEAARDMQVRLGVKAKHWHRRRNAGFILQGEWFFLPRPEFQPSPLDVVLEDEPIRRGSGKPHHVEMLCRNGGTTVYVHDKHPNGLTQAQYNNLLFRKPEAKMWPWRVMRANPQVYVKGRVRHPDHATVFLPFWHQVVMNRESLGAHVAFLD